MTCGTTDVMHMCSWVRWVDVFTQVWPKRMCASVIPAELDSRVRSLAELEIDVHRLREFCSAHGTHSTKLWYAPPAMRARRLMVQWCGTFNTIAAAHMCERGHVSGSMLVQPWGGAPADDVLAWEQHCRRRTIQANRARALRGLRRLLPRIGAFNHAAGLCCRDERSSQREPLTRRAPESDTRQRYAKASPSQDQLIEESVAHHSICLPPARR